MSDTSSPHSNIMDGIPRPPTLCMPQSSSAPVSRVVTPPPVRRNRGASLPVSPIAKKQPLSPLARDLLKSSSSPTRAIRKRHARVTFNRYNPRSPRLQEKLLTRCPVHAYSTINQELAVLPSRAVGGVKFGDTPRTQSMAALCPKHAYATIEAELAVLPSTAFGGVKFGDTPRDCLAPQRSNCPVHVYAEAKSSLSHKGGALFSTSKEGRDSYMASNRALAPVHAYASPATTLRTAGGVAFGSTAPRAGLLTSMTRTGLLTATSTPRRTAMADRTPRAPRTLPKLVPPPVAMHKLVEAEEDESGSPREIEALLA